MKTTLLAFCFLCATAALGQSYPSMSPLEFVDHSQHAGPKSLTAPADLLGGSSVVIGHGEVPLADIPMPKIPETPLGDVARQVRKERLSAKKAQKVWENPIYGTNVVQVAR